VVIRKPGKDAYTKLNAYPSILLISCMGKVIEKGVMELLSGASERRGLLINEQFVSRKGQSAIMVDRAQAVWTHRNISGMLLLDIQAGFKSVAKGRLVNRMKV
jgi:hypothetical protein